MFIQKFESKDQILAKVLINAGLGQYFGFMIDSIGMWSETWFEREI